MEEVERVLSVLPTAIRAAKEYEGIFTASANYAYEECFSHPISV
jgi:hypothetical protein